MAKAEAPPHRRLILVVDDLEGNRELLRDLVETLGHQTVQAENGKAALRQMADHDPDLVLLDLKMPEMNGFQVLENMRNDALLRDIPVVVISGLSDMASVVKSIELGADDYLTKPFNTTLLATRIDACLEKKRWRDQAELYRRMIEEQNIYLKERVRIQVQLIKEQTRQISKAQIETIFALSKLAESRDPETGEHLGRIREYSRLVAGYIIKHPMYASVLDESFVDNIFAASPLHDIGKVGIPDSILRKPTQLSDEEWAVMQTHTTIGAETLRAVNRSNPGNAFVYMGIQIAQSHHERWDGSGYPQGLAGYDIPLPARILALADVYDALTSKRCYKEAYSHEHTRNEILEGRGRHFDPVMVDAFLETEKDFLLIQRRLCDE